MLRATLRKLCIFYIIFLVAPGCTSTAHTGTPSFSHINMCAKRNAAYVMRKRILWAMNEFAVSLDLFLQRKNIISSSVYKFHIIVIVYTLYIIIIIISNLCLNNTFLLILDVSNLYSLILMLFRSVEFERKRNDEIPG